MSKEKNLVEDALIQMKNLEEAVAENAKGILASTMKQEIKELVKESIVSEQDDETETDDEMEVDMDSDEEEMDMDMDSDEEEMDMDMDSDEEEMDMDMDSDMNDTEMSDDEVIDLSGSDISDEDLLKVFLAMDENDGVIVKKDNNMVNLRDENTDKEYMIRTESEEEEFYEDMSMEDGMYEEDEMDMNFEEDEMDMDSDEEEMDIDSIVDQVFSKHVGSMEEDDQIVYEIEMDDKEEYFEQDIDDLDEEDMELPESAEPEDDTIYEISLEDEEDEEYQMESTTPKVGKGVKKIGKKPGFSYGKTSGGFKENMKQGTRGVGMGKGPKKFEFKEGDKNISNVVKKEAMSFGKKKETKEAARTLGSGSRFRRGGLPKPRAYSKNNINIDEQRNSNQIQILREKNEEYRKALNVFRDKLNEVAIFNSNLAYASRLFTEHPTSKQEKINILRRFDSVETLKESKNLYRTIKSELTSTNKPSINESIERKIENSPSSGSASTLIESKTYENPQFLRMKDIMSKIIK